MTTYTCASCSDQIGFFHASAGMLCVNCKTPAATIKEAQRYPLSSVVTVMTKRAEEITELERLLSL